MLELLNVLIGLVGLSTIGLYIYVALAVLRMELKSMNSLSLAVVKACVWPVTIWHTIEKLYEI